MTRDQIVHALTTFVSVELLGGQSDDLDERTPMLELGIIDSMSIVSLIMFVERRCRVSVPSDLVRPESFRDISSIAALVMTLTPSEG